MKHETATSVRQQVSAGGHPGHVAGADRLNVAHAIAMDFISSSLPYRARPFWSLLGFAVRTDVGLVYADETFVICMGNSGACGRGRLRS
jgi:hypothetical protein